MLLASRFSASPSPRSSGLHRPDGLSPANPSGYRYEREADAQIIDLVAFQYTTAPTPAPVFGSILRLGIALGLAVGCVLYLQALKQVTVLDGAVAQRIETFAPTVGAALDRAGVQLGPLDRVAPGLDAPLTSNEDIEVLRSRRVVMVVNGDRLTEQVTGRTVDDVLSELSITSNDALVSPTPATPVSAGDEIVVAQTVEATVAYDGKTQSVQTNALTAGGLLRQLGVVLGPYDRVEPSILTYPSAGTTIKVVRVNQAIEKVHSKVPFERKTEPSSSLELGTRKVQTSGVEGVRESSYEILYEDGVVKSRNFLGATVIKDPVTEVTQVGTHRPSLSSATRSQTGIASWYRQPGLMAAHRSLPFGTVVRVTNLDNGRHVTVTIRDRGPYIDGRIIDLSDTAFNQISSQSRGVANVKIEW